MSELLITRYWFLIPDGAIAQLGERLLCKQEVVGSIPSGSTRSDRAVRKPQFRPWENGLSLSIPESDLLSDIVKRGSI
jgi:hypothetical protein